MFRNTFLIILILALIPVASFPQSRLDTLEQRLQEAGPEERARIFIDISEIYWQRSYDTSLLMATHALNLAERIGDSELKASALNMMGIAFYLTGDFASALDYYFQSLTLNEELEDSSSIAILYNNIGAVYIDLKDFQKALSYLKNAQDIFNELGNDKYMFSILNNIGAAYIDLKMYDTAYQYLTEAYEFALGSKNQTDISISLNNLGDITLKMGLYSRSGEFLGQALEISDSLDDKAMMATILTNLGYLSLKRSRYREALEHLMNALRYAEDVHSLPDKREIFRYLSEYHEVMNDDKEALHYYKLYNAAGDSILSEEDHMKIKEMEIAGNARYLHQEIRLLKMENEINRLKQNRQRILIFFLAAIAIMGIMVFVIYYQKNRFKRQTNRLLAEKNVQLEEANKKLKESEQHLKELNSTKDKFFSIIGHDLRNPLNALLGFSELISGNSREYTFEEIHKYSKIINEAAKNIHLLIENLLEWSRSQSGNIDFSPSNKEIFPVIEEIVRVFAIQADKKNIKINIAVPEKTSAHFDQNLLSTILRNLVNNAIKFTPRNGEVNISSKTGQDEITISVKDTGIGMSKEQMQQLFNLTGTLSMTGTSEEKGTGLGLILCKEFVDMHGGRIWVESHQGKGSDFSFTLPSAQNKQ